MKLMIIDDHSVLREGVAEILRQAWPGTVVLQAHDVERAITAMPDEADIDAIILDLNFPGASGFSGLSHLGKAKPGVPVIILSSSEEAADVYRAIELGARGYVTKSASASTLISALNLVLSGETYLPPLLAERSNANPAPAARLTSRQLDVLNAICRGLSNKDIGQQLALSEKTVKVHVSAIFRALNVVSRTQAVNAARRAKLVQL